MAAQLLQRKIKQKELPYLRIVQWSYLCFWNIFDCLFYPIYSNNARTVMGALLSPGIQLDSYYHSQFLFSSCQKIT